MKNNSKNSIYLRSISCRGVKSPLPFKPSLYASISLSNSPSKPYKTLTDSKNGENPEWDCSEMKLDLDLTDGQDSLLQIDLTDQIAVFPDRLVGSVKIPVVDLVNGGSGGRVSYQVKNCEGRPNGTVTVWYGSGLSREFAMSPPAQPATSSPEQYATSSPDFSHKPPLEQYQAYPSSPLGNNLFPNFHPSFSPLTNQNQINSPIYPPLNANPSNNSIYPPVVDPGFGSGANYYPQPGTLYPPVESHQSEFKYYPQVERVGEAVYYPPPETRSCDCREVTDPGLGYGESNGFYPPPPPRYQYY